MVMDVFAGTLLVVTGTGAVWGTTAAAARGRLRRNVWVGIRLESTRASDAAWLAGHQAALPISRTIGIASLIIGLAMIIVDDKGSVLFWSLFIIGYGGGLLASIIVLIQANRAAQAVTQQSQHSSDAVPHRP